MAAPAFAASSRDGQLRGERAEGFYDHDRRLLHTLCLLLDDREPEPIGVQPLGPHQVRFTAVHRYPRDRTDDPTLIVERVRTAGDGETITLRNIGTLGRRLRVWSWSPPPISPTRSPVPTQVNSCTSGPLRWDACQK
ncbi:glycogen debranching N-terminal domain-containing protein [Streptomyces sp. A30]|uniref:glycogen debranching N-terminal domain-containing protein n=1 Tax=Streptomyces sp. A30 TaxID=2789273 RepID=UPI00397F7194